MVGTLRRSYYEILGVSATADLEEIKRRYRELVRLYHPDVAPSTEEAREAFAEILEAYRVLSEEESRKLYDAEALPVLSVGELSSNRPVSVAPTPLASSNLPSRIVRKRRRLLAQFSRFALSSDVVTVAPVVSRAVRRRRNRIAWLWRGGATLLLFSGIWASRGILYLSDGVLVLQFLVLYGLAMAATLMNASLSRRFVIAMAIFVFVGTVFYLGAIVPLGPEGQPLFSQAVRPAQDRGGG